MKKKSSYKELPYRDPIEYIAALQNKQNIVFLDSAMAHPTLGRYSYICFDPIEIITSHLTDEENIFSRLQEYITPVNNQNIPGLPPFQGGIAGYFSYDLCRTLEKIDGNARDDMQFPLAILGIYDTVLSFDHVLQKAWLITHRANPPVLPIAELVISKAARAKTPVHSNFTQDQYIAAVKRCINYIAAGDIFEVNLSQRFHATLPDNVSPWDLYLKLRVENAAPFAAFLQFGNIALASASPERFLQCMNDHVESRPIKGTTRRSDDIDTDKQLAQQLLTSEKDRAENIMIVDLLRNDLSKVCEDNSVHVSQLCGLESYATVHHLVSVIEGRLRPQHNSLDLLKACFPGGSITGAPKIRAMEIIDELEPNWRGPYCGAIGYIGYHGSMDMSITIRTYAIKGSELTFQAGGAVMLHSNPQQEYEESLLKAKALLDILN